MSLPVISPKSHRIAVVHKDDCFSKKCHLECIKFCPVNLEGSDCIVLGDDGKATINESLCNGCGICIKKCPFDAINIINLAQEIGEHKIHQYGNNSFRLYKLPDLKSGKIIGLVGRNGMGKTTALNILSGNLKPNLGNFETSPSWDEILDYFHGTELKNHFQKISTNDLRVSIKPQAVYELKDIWKDDCKSLLNTIDKKSTEPKLEGINAIEELSLENNLNKKLDELSGGDLQRLSIAIACQKDADLYLFDEPSSYNDVYQRIAVANIIRKLSDLGKTVLLVEHDITFLDYLSNSIHILYGENAAYGIISTAMPSRTGINVLLDGYLPNENIRFRDNPVTFDSVLHSDVITDSNTIVKYSDLTKSYDDFEVSIKSGEIKERDVIGIIGPNSIGKTTFMQILAGLIKTNSGEINKKASISYKPQYLKSDFNDTVHSLLSSINDEMLEEALFQTEMLRPLKIMKLYEKQVNELSGGELQKISILMCLMQNADIYALDEPSAFVDVEDRLVIGRAINKFIKNRGKSAIIIDHDIQLIDLISDKLIIFQGKPGINGIGSGIQSKFGGMNMFLKDMEITYRRDIESGRPRVNKPGSRLDREQKTSGVYYHIKTQ